MMQVSSKGLYLVCYLFVFSYYYYLQVIVFNSYCSRGEIRTHNLRLRRALLYPIKPLDYAKPKLKIASKITIITPVANTPIAKISARIIGIIL